MEMAMTFYINKFFMDKTLNQLQSDPALNMTRLIPVVDFINGQMYNVTLAQLQSLFQFAVNVSYAGPADPTVDPGIPTGKVFYTAGSAGTYTNFKDSTNTAIIVGPTDGLVILSFNGTFWVKQMASLIDLSNYVQKTTDQSINGTITFNNSPLVPLPTTAMQATPKQYTDSILNKLDTYISANITNSLVKDSSSQTVVAFTQNAGSYLKTNGVITASTGWIYSSNIPITPLTKIYEISGFTTASINANVINIGIYYKDGTFQYIQGNSVYTTIFSNLVDHIVLSGYNTDFLTITVNSYNIQGVENLVNNAIDTIYGSISTLSVKDATSQTVVAFTQNAGS
jgi:hypothetical protein